MRKGSAEQKARMQAHSYGNSNEEDAGLHANKAANYGIFHIHGSRPGGTSTWKYTISN